MMSIAEMLLPGYEWAVYLAYAAIIALILRRKAMSK